MTGFLNDYLTVLAPHFGKALISSESLANIEAVAKNLPGETTSFFGFECRLGEKAPKADFLLCVAAGEVGREILAGSQPKINLSEALQQHPIWNRVSNFCRNWANPASSLHQNAKNIWLEFDIDKSPAKVPIPSVFFGTYKDNANNSQWINQTALKLLRGKPLPSHVEQNLLHCFNLLPTDAWVFQIGMMLARQVDAVRICIRGINAEQILGYLSAIGWTGNREELKVLLSNLSTNVDRIDLDLDIGDVVYPKIGLECYLTQPSLEESRWKSFLDYLVANKLCLLEKRDALLAYPGYSLEKTNSQIWPSHLLNVSNFLAGRAIGVIGRDIHHIKVVYNGDRALEAKAYLSVRQGWLSTALIKQQLRELQNASI
jgi:hypothetical protein